MRVWPGHPYPLGADWDGEGVNFAIFSENASGVELCLFSGPDDAVEIRKVDSDGHKAGEFVHVDIVADARSELLIIGIRGEFAEIDHPLRILFLEARLGIVSLGVIFPLIAQIAEKFMRDGLENLALLS